MKLSQMMHSCLLNMSLLMSKQLKETLKHSEKVTFLKQKFML